ncbi:MAG TPA: SDR family NAD(P)-dependent oxidoreductase [Polyangiaceae bacterium]|nr:SDR family NAD(P)-dependent oxidoreductase [Polyangiaceae bacterium]
MDWNGRVALVTGASSGIGLAVARAVVARGGRAGLVARSRDKLAAAVRELGTDRAEAFPVDVTDRDALAGLPRAVVARFGRLDVVVNNAGVNHRGDVRRRSAGELAEILDTNLVAPVLLTHAALAHLPPGGVVVNVASLAGKVPVPHEAAYSGSKAGLRAFARALRFELADEGRGVRVCTVCPGPVDTAFFGDLREVPDLVFSQPMSSAEQVADVVVRAIERGPAEVDIPAASGKLATLGYLLPRLFAALRPALERRGARSKGRYLARRGVGVRA